MSARAPQGVVTAQGKVARLTRKQTKKIFLRAVTGQSKIKNLQEEGTGQEKARCETKMAGDRPATGQKGAARLKKLQVTDLRGQTGQRPVQPVHYAGSTGFNQDGPGKIWLKAAELKFSSEVQLASSS